MKSGLLIFACLLLNFKIQSQKTVLDQGWTAFSNNEIQLARTYFTQAKKDRTTQREASLGLGFLSLTDKTSQDAFDNFRDFYEGNPTAAPFLSALWHSSVVFELSDRKTGEQVTLLKQIAQADNQDGSLNAQALATLGSHYQAAGDHQKFISTFGQISTLVNWQVCGAFENVSGSGFDKEYEPVKCQENKTFVDKFGAKVNWFDLPVNRHDKWIDLTLCLSWRESIIYAQTFIESNTEQEVQLRIGTSGSVKAWVNDALVLTEEEERNNGIDTYISKILLHKGFNRILLQLGESELGQLNFLARLTNDKGISLSDIKSVSTFQAFEKEKTYISRRLSNFAEAFFIGAIKAHPEQLINYLILTEAYIKNGYYTEASRTLLQAIQLAPKCSYLRNRLAEVYTLADNTYALDETVNWLGQNNSDDRKTLTLLFDDQLSRKDYKAADTTIKRLEKLYGISELSQQKRARLAMADKEHTDPQKMVNEAYKRFPDNYDILWLKCDMETNTYHRAQVSINALKKFLSGTYKESAESLLAENYFAIQDMDNAIKTYEDLVTKYPYRTQYMHELGRCYIARKQYSQAQHWYLNALKVSPQSSYCWNMVGALCEAQPGEKGTVAAYERAMDFDPGSYLARNNYRRAKKLGDIFGFFKNPDITQLLKDAPAASAYPEDNALIIDAETQRVVYSTGSEVRYISLIKLFNSNGIAQLKERTIYYNKLEDLKIEAAEVIKANGTRVKAEIQDAHIVFTSLEPNDAIYLVYHLEERHNTGKIAQYFEDRCSFSSPVPYLHQSYNLLIPTTIKFNYVFSQDSIPVHITELKFMNMYTWEKKDEPGLKPEQNMPPFSDVAQILYLSSIPDWKTVSSWYADLALPKTKSDDDIHRIVSQLLARKENYSDLQKAKILYSYIVSNVRYSSVPFLQNGIIPQKATKVIHTRIGDCKDVATLFVTMCKEAGLKAGLMLINTADQGKTSMPLPSKYFNHCIATLSTSSEKYYVDLTSDWLPFNTLHPGLQNAIALEIRPDSDTTVNKAFVLNPTRGLKNIRHYTTHINIENDQVNIDYTSLKTGFHAAVSRAYFKNIGKTEQEKRIQEFISTDYPGVLVKNMDIENLTNQADTVLSHISFMSDAAFKKAGNIKLLQLPWGNKAHTKDFVFGPHRSYPIKLNDNVDDASETLIVRIPPTEKLAETPKNIHYSCSLAEYKLEYKISGSEITMERNLKFKTDIVPLEKLSEFKEFYSKVVAADDKGLVFRNGN